MDAYIKAYIQYTQKLVFNLLDLFSLDFNFFLNKKFLLLQFFHLSLNHQILINIVFFCSPYLNFLYFPIFYMIKLTISKTIFQKSFLILSEEQIPYIPVYAIFTNHMYHHLPNKSHFLHSLLHH